jgi:hypothetical protein
MVSRDLVVQTPAESRVPGAFGTNGAGRVPDAIRRRAAHIFDDVVKVHEQLRTILEDYPSLAATVQGIADEIDDYDRAIRLEEQVGMRLIFGLLVDMSYQIGEATGWEPQPIDPVLARRPRAAWPATAWPLSEPGSSGAGTVALQDEPT